MNRPLLTALLLAVAPSAMIATANARMLDSPPTEALNASADADMKAVLDKLTALGAKPVEQLSVEQARTQPSPADAVRAVLADMGRPTAPPPGVTTVDVQYPAGVGLQPARVYKPEGAKGPLPVILYIHGGGWVIATIDTYDATPRALVRETGAIVVSIDYRKAPEHKFPAAHDDANAAYRWLLANAASWGGDPARVAVAGESAGGNMAFDVAAYARDNGLTRPAHMLLVYPVAGKDMTTPSYIEDANAAPLSKAGLQWFIAKTFRSPAEAGDSRIDLVDRADLKGLPPATIVNAELDPLRSEGEVLAKRLRAAGVPVTQMTYRGVTHEFFGADAVVKDAKAAQRMAGQKLKAALR